MSEMLEAGLTSKSWPFEEARRVLKRYQNAPPAKGHVLFETGYGPSGLPHIGTFGEVARTSMVMRAFREISDIPCKLICFSDDLDGMRKVPQNVPNQKMLEENLQRPLTSVPDPFEKYESFGQHNNELLKKFLDTFDFQYDFISATEFYRSGKFDKILIKALENYDEIMSVMLKSLRDERRETYSIFLPIHPVTGRVLYVPMKEVNSDNSTVTFADENGKDWTLPVTGGNVKLQWKPDFGARWAALGIDFEMYGKDHSTNTPIYDKICRILGHLPPEHFTYELFLDENGQKISKTSGNGVSIEDWLKYASSESLSYFMYQKPKTAKRLHFDIIPKMVDEYHQQLRAYSNQDFSGKLNNPVWHIHGNSVPKSHMAIPFSMLLNLVETSNAENKELLWKFVKKYKENISEKDHPIFDNLVGYAIKYFNDVIKAKKKYKIPDQIEKKALEALISTLDKCNDKMTPEEIQTLIYSTGKENGYSENLRDWFKLIYEVVFGEENGPRMGYFVSFFGLKETIELMKDKINNN